MLRCSAFLIKFSTFLSHLTTLPSVAGKNKRRSGSSSSQNEAINFIIKHDVLINYSSHSFKGRLSQPQKSFSLSPVLQDVMWCWMKALKDLIHSQNWWWWWILGYWTSEKTGKSSECEEERRDSRDFDVRLHLYPKKRLYRLLTQHSRQSESWVEENFSSCRGCWVRKYILSTTKTFLLEN